MKQLLYISTLLLIACTSQVQAQQDSTITKKKKAKKVQATENQVRFGIDISKPIENAFLKNRTGYEFQADYYYKNDVYFTLEGGFGGSNYDYDNLSYTSTNGFFRVGVDKGLLRRIGGSDWDMAFVGARYGMAIINRSEGNYLIVDPLWGNSTGTVPAKSFTGHWAELNAGVRVELFKGIFAGWNVRGKFLINQGQFKELPPSYVAGYGKGDKNTVFDFNFYISYALRWNKPAAESK